MLNTYRVNKNTCVYLVLCLTQCMVSFNKTDKDFNFKRNCYVTNKFSGKCNS